MCSHSEQTPRSGIPFKWLFWLAFGPRLERKVKTYGTDLQILCRYSQSNRWRRCFITVSLKMDGLSGAPSPIQDPAPGLGSRSGLCFPGRRLLLGGILRCPLAANVLAADGGEASEFRFAAERNRSEHLLMNESAAR